MQNLKSFTGAIGRRTPLRPGRSDRRDRPRPTGGPGRRREGGPGACGPCGRSRRLPRKRPPRRCRRPTSRPIRGSQTRILTSAGETTSTNSALTRWGKWGSVSIFGPMPHTQSSPSRSTKLTQCGLPMETQVTSQTGVAAHAASRRPPPGPAARRRQQASWGSAGRRGSAGPCARGPAGPVRRGPPGPASARRRRSSIVSRPRRQMPWSWTYLATQRTPLPHISDSEPSALNICIRASATVEGRIRIKPSPPTPKWRSGDTPRQSRRIVRHGFLEAVDVERSRSLPPASW